jgi:hypothetical protein
MQLREQDVKAAMNGQMTDELYRQLKREIDKQMQEIKNDPKLLDNDCGCNKK